MNLPSDWKTRLGGCAVAAWVQRWMGTLEYQSAYYDRSVDWVLPEYAGPVIWAFWHESLLIPLYLRGHSKTAMLLSQSRDAQWLAEAGQFLGLEAIRGSTFRGSRQALRDMLDKCQNMNLAITPDGPRGPRRQMAQGPIWLAARSGLPVVALGLGYDRPWRLPTWDKFAIPRPFTRARIIFSPPMFIPAHINRAGVEYYRQRAETLLNWVTSAAEHWAETGRRVVGQVPTSQQAFPLEIRRRVWPRLPLTRDDVLTLSPREAA